MELKQIHIKDIQQLIDGDLFTDKLHKSIYSTDASVYRETPLAVVYPKHKEDVKQIVAYAKEQNIAIIPRAAGTSLAGQVVGNGLVVDCTKYMNQIIEINPEEKWVRVQPGVVLDELNQFLANYGLFFGPETSTSTHCTLGGMFGNNSCGTRSILYGSTRQHTLQAEVVLYDGELATFSAKNKPVVQKEINESTKGRIYDQLLNLLEKPGTKELIKKRFPPVSVIRRNTGYALDYLINSCYFTEGGPPLNICELLAGSEGTLAFTTELTLNLVELPLEYQAVVCVQHHSIAEACAANLIALACKPTAVELMDDIVLRMARENPIQREQSKFINGLPKAILLVEFQGRSAEELQLQIDEFLAQIEPTGLSHYHTVLYGGDVKKVWDLRKAGLGVLGNMVGDKKPVALVEDTAVDPKVLPEYIAEFESLMHKYHNECVFYAHISAGELHLRPILNLKDEKDRILFRKIGQESAELVAKYNGSISGEHGDGRLRGEFIPIQYGEEILHIFKKVKQIFDPHNLFNPNKIVDTPPMDKYLRYESNQETKEFDTLFDFSDDLGILRAAEKCNGVGYCRKSPAIGGTMCPSFQATRFEKDSTRARANTLREVLTHSTEDNPFTSPEIYEALDLCLSCKGCKTECPSSVDMAKLKAETLYQRYKNTGFPRRSKLIGNTPLHMQRFQFAAPLINFGSQFGFAKKMLGFSTKRSLPKLQSTTLQQWSKQRTPKKTNQTIYFFNDEFLNLYDVSIGKKAIQLLEHLGYTVHLVNGLISGRTFLSKGMLEEAKQHAQKNVYALHDKITSETPLVGIEPSAILTFRDEYVDLLRNKEKEKAKAIATYSFTVEEFLAQEIEKGNITPEQFTPSQATAYIHGHCQQKALIGTSAIHQLLSIIPQLTIKEIPSGCCGMAGSFGYEEEHYSLSMKIGELVLFPAVRRAKENDWILAPGTSCRHQIKDGTKKHAHHPVELLWHYLKK